MTTPLTNTVRWVGRHALPAVAVTLIAAAAAGGGITYAMTSQPAASTASPSAAASGTKPATSTPATGKRPAGVFVHRVLTIVVKDTGMTLPTIRADLATGESLDQVAGANAAKLESDVVAAIVKARGARAATATSPTTTSRLAARVHALMSEPGQTLLAQLSRLHTGGYVPPVARPGAKGVRPWASPRPTAAA